MGAASELEAGAVAARDGRPGWLGPSLRVLSASVVMVALGAGTIALASQRVAPLSESPTATEFVENAPLGEAFRDIFVGTQGVYDPAAGIVSPDQVAFELEIQAAHNGEDIFFRYRVPTPLPSYYHDYFVYQDGKWIRVGRSPVGNEPHGLYEDRISMLVDDGSVKGFANQGGWLTCHDDMRNPFMYGGPPNDEVVAHPIAEALRFEEVRKYLPQSRDAGPEWWRANGWDAIDLGDLDKYEARREAGVFLDLWHWRSHRSNPIGFSDNESVFEYRRPSPGRGPFSTNFDSEAGQPLLMFDSAVTGYDALDWDTVQAQGYGYDDNFFIADGVNAVPFDPDREWRNGDVIPRRMLNTEPTESRGSIRADGRLLSDGEGGWVWDVTLWRPMDTGYPTADKPFLPGRTYDAAIAVHRLATGSRWHFVTLPFRIGVDMPADVTATRFDGDAPDWDAIEATTLTAIYPGQTNWEFLTSDDHPGATEVRNDSMSVLGCHDDPIGLGAANRAIEPRLAGVALPDGESRSILIRAFDPGNAAFVFFIIALLTVGGAIVLGRARKATTEEPDDTA
ncbi:MAG: ethylbenzene dehydrogenase-related protein [Acidimicrobiia bacterium]